MENLKVIDYVNGKKEQILKIYHDLHELAEPSWEEKKTSNYLIETLKKNGLSPITYEDHYGFYVDIKGESDEVIALRADMDALVQNVDGVVMGNHSCGHDAHSTMVLHSALAIANCQIHPRKTLRFIFQPAEEVLGGALRMKKDGALKNVTKLFGVHLRPSIEIPYGKASPVIEHGAIQVITGTIKGLQSHASRPELGKNAIEVAAMIIQSLKCIRLQETCPFSVKMTKIQDGGGTSSNIIPDLAQFVLDLRAQTNLGMEQLRIKTIECMKSIAYLTETQIEWEFGAYAPAATSKDNVIEFARKAIAQVMGEENVYPTCKTPGGEDFHFYSFKDPDIESTMIGLGCDLKPGLHHPNMSFNLNALIYGTQILTLAMLETDSAM